MCVSVVWSYAGSECVCVCVCVCVCGLVICRQSGAKHLDAMFGKARCLVLQQNFGLAVDLMNQAVVMVTNYLPAIIEKMKMQLAINDWEQVVDSAHRSEFPTILSVSV